MGIVGVGIDLVSIPDFAEQVDQPGTVFAETFSRDSHATGSCARRGRKLCLDGSRRSVGCFKMSAVLLGPAGRVGCVGLGAVPISLSALFPGGGRAAVRVSRSAPTVSAVTVG